LKKRTPWVFFGEIREMLVFCVQKLDEASHSSNSSHEMKPPIRAAYEVAEEHGIKPDRCHILQDAHTIVVRLTESLVARVVTDIDGPRQGKEWFARETTIAAHLTKHHAPIIPLHPAISPHAHTKDGYTMNFWQHVTITDMTPSPLDIGHTLHQCHEILRSFTGPLPHLAILHESLSILNSPLGKFSFEQDILNLLLHHIQYSIDFLSPLPHQPLHGDAHNGNLIMTNHGLLWTDWEDAFSGPVEWDLASIIWNVKYLDKDQQTADSITSAYDSNGMKLNKDTLHQCLIGRAAVMCTWYPILYPNPSQDRINKPGYRINWLMNLKS
jgi:thiamine kinase-like enzyme